jgi:hypothetical protein
MNIKKNFQPRSNEMKKKNKNEGKEIKFFYKRKKKLRKAIK